MAKKSMIQREIKRKGLVNKFSRKRKIIKEKLTNNTQMFTFEGTL